MRLKIAEVASEPLLHVPEKLSFHAMSTPEQEAHLMKLLLAGLTRFHEKKNTTSMKCFHVPAINIFPLFIYIVWKICVLSISSDTLLCLSWTVGMNVSKLQWLHPRYPRSDKSWTENLRETTAIGGYFRTRKCTFVKGCVCLVLVALRSCITCWTGSCIQLLFREAMKPLMWLWLDWAERVWHVSLASVLVSTLN